MEREHLERVAPLARATLQRRSLGQTHPVWDFLFSYYTFPPGRLLTWVPGLVDDNGHLRTGSLSENDGLKHQTWAVPPLKPRVVELAFWIADLCERMLERPSRHHCYGLHEWAMVYRLAPDQVRHASCLLRLPPDQIAGFVESQTLSCTHYDAFRFFTPAARPRNQLQPGLENRLDLEQRGCVHANMDLYKWSYKLWPWIGSTLVGQTFELAVAGRELDMRASPYDLSHLGFEAIPIETSAGREDYAAAQRRLTECADALRRRLATAARTLVFAQTQAGPTPPLPAAS